MQKAIELVTTELRSTHDSEAIERWYISYLKEKEHPKSMFRDVLSITMPDIESSDVLESTAMLFEMSQKAADEMSLKDVDHSYEYSMEVISIFTVYNLIFPIIEKHVKDKTLGSRILGIYNDASMHMNRPRKGSLAVLEGRRRFFFDLYIPVMIYFICTGRNCDMKDKEEEFVRMYLMKRKGSERNGACIDQFCKKMSCGEEKVHEALEFLFCKAY
ncbi:hypothetical protein KMI_03g05610 [Encephalitozoon hellem]|nr:hypothetical protein KMI_03g05610 [Encephalitozoon hellem]